MRGEMIGRLRWCVSARQAVDLESLASLPGPHPHALREGPTIIR
jgi:hypothetical protein